MKALTGCFSLQSKLYSTSLVHPSASTRFHFRTPQEVKQHILKTHKRHTKDPRETHEIPTHPNIYGALFLHLQRQINVGRVGPPRATIVLRDEKGSIIYVPMQYSTISLVFLRRCKNGRITTPPRQNETKRSQTEPKPKKPNQLNQTHRVAAWHVYCVQLAFFLRLDT